MYNGATPSTDTVRKFKVGDVVRPLPNQFDHCYLHLRPKIIRFVNDHNIILDWTDGDFSTYNIYGFALAEESIIDMVLNKYKDEAGF